MIKSFSLIRTNPLLSSNAKLTVLSNGELEINSFDTGPILIQNRYKNYKVNFNSSWGKDLSNFWKNTSPEEIYKVYNSVNLDKISDDFSQQNNNFYSYGTERLNSLLWDEEFRILAPLWLNQTLPSKFVIFRIKNPLTNNYNDSPRKDTRWFMNNEKLEVVKVVDIKNSNLGIYLKNHLNNFIDEPKPIYVSFNENKYSEYRGISLSTGSVINVPENNYKRIANLDSTIISYDEFVTEGFKRNNIINNNLINLEFLFDDVEVEDFSINRYLGFYVDEFCEEIITIKDINLNELTLTNNVNKPVRKSSVNYVKISDVDYNIISEINSDKIVLTEDASKVNLFKEYRVLDNAFSENTGRDYLLLEITGQPLHGDEYTFSGIGKIIADFTIPAGQNVNNRFSVAGNTNNIALALSKAIKYKAKDEFSAINDGNQVIVFGNSRFSYIGDKYKISKSNIVGDTKIKITGIDNGNDYSWINFNTGFDKVVVSGEIEIFLNSLGKENVFVQAIDGTFHNINFVFKFLDKPIFVNNLIVGFENFNDLVSIEIKYNKPIKFENNKLKIFLRNTLEKGKFSFLEVKDFDYEFTDDDEDPLKYYNKENYSLVTSDNETVIHPDFNNFLDNRKKIKIIDKQLDQIEIINDSYDKLQDLYLLENSKKSNYSPYILKWVSGENVLNNPYRLNNSETFGITNYSPNFLINSRNHYYYTHEWFNFSEYPDWFDLNTRKKLKQYYNSNLNFSELLNQNEDYFSKYFTLEKIIDGVDEYPIKTRYNYSVVNNLNDVFFKGVSLQIFERIENEIVIDNNLNSIKSVNTGKYFGYKFSNIIVPETNEIAPKISVEVIINEKWRWILFVVKVNLNQDINVLNDGNLKIDYAMLYLLNSKIKELVKNINGNYEYNSNFYDIVYSDIFLSGVVDLNLNPGSRSEKLTPGTVWDIVAFERDFSNSIPNLLTELNVNELGLFNVIRVFSKLLLNSYQTSSDYIQIEVDKKISENSLKANRIFINSLSGEIDLITELADFNYWEQRKSVYLQGGFNYFIGVLEGISFAAISSLINSGNKDVKYTTYDINGKKIENNFFVRFNEPDQITKNVDLDVEKNQSSVNLINIDESTIGYNLIKKSKPFTVSLSRYSINYEPKFIDVFNFVDILDSEEIEKNKNLFLTYNNLISEKLSEDISEITRYKNFIGLKCSDFINKDSFLSFSQYPLINETTLFLNEVDLFTNNWDVGYYKNFYSKDKFALTELKSTKEEKSYFGSKLVKLGDEILLEKIPLEYFVNTSNGDFLSLSINVKQYFIDTIYDKMYDNVKNYLPEKGSDFLKKYIEINVIDAYKLTEFKLWGAKSLIFELLENNLDEISLRSFNYKILKNYFLVKNNEFSFNINKDLIEENSFGFSIKYNLK